MRNRLAMDAPDNSFLLPRNGGDGGSPSSGCETDAGFNGLSTHVYA
jgi:hypothetical protein